MGEGDIERWSGALLGRYYLLCSGQNFVVETSDFGPVKMCRHGSDGKAIELGVVPSIGEALRFTGLDAGAKCFEFNGSGSLHEYRYLRR